VLDKEDDLINPLEVSKTREAISTETAAAKDDGSASLSAEARLWEESVDSVFLDLV
jgi:hypothetical protein